MQTRSGDTLAGRLKASVFGLTLLCFLLPFVTVACPGRSFTFSGTQLALGTTVEEPQLFGSPKARQVDGEPLALAALGITGIGIGVAFVSGRRGHAFTTAAGVSGLVCLLALKGKIDDDVAAQAIALLKVSYGVGFWLAISGFVAAGLVGLALQAVAAGWVKEVARLRATLENVPLRHNADGEVLTNETVTEMVAAGLGDKLVMQKISCSRCSFALSSSDLAQLKGTGVSDEVIASMLTNQANDLGRS